MSDMIFDPELNEKRKPAADENTKENCPNAQELELNIRLDQDGIKGPGLSVNLKVNKEKTEKSLDVQIPEQEKEKKAEIVSSKEAPEEQVEETKSVSSEEEQVQESEDEDLPPAVPKKKKAFKRKEKKTETEPVVLDLEKVDEPVLYSGQENYYPSGFESESWQATYQGPVYPQDNSQSYIQQPYTDSTFSQAGGIGYGNEPYQQPYDPYSQVNPVYQSQIAEPYESAQAGYQNQSYSYQEPVQQTYQSEPVHEDSSSESKSKKGTALPYTLFGITLVALIGLGVWFYMVHSNSSTLQSQLDQANQNASDLERMNESYQSEIGELNSQIDELENKVDDLTQELEDKNQELEDLNKEEEEYQESEDYTASEFLSSIETNYDEQNWSRVVELYGQMASRYPDEEQTQTAYNYYAQAQQHLQSDNSTT